jgi:hypothetical protein
MNFLHSVYKLTYMSRVSSICLYVCLPLQKKKSGF